MKHIPAEKGAAGIFQSGRVRCRFFLFAAILPLLFTACDFQYPRDPEKTLDKVLSRERVVVAAVEHPPWVFLSAEGELRGAEVELVEAFAQDLSVDIEWRRLPDYLALRGLTSGDIDLVIGGLEQQQVHSVEGAGASYPYFEEVFVIGVRAEHPLPEQLEGAEVFVPPDEPLDELVRGEEGVPTKNWGPEIAFAALPHWALASHGLERSNIVLRRVKRVMAVRAGENAWLMRLERLLRDQRRGLEARLREYHS